MTKKSETPEECFSDPFGETSLGPAELMQIIIKAEAIKDSLVKLGEDITVQARTKEERHAGYWAEQVNIEFTLQHLKNAFYEANRDE